MKITALTENTSQCGLPVEHGLSLYIQTDTHTILFDTGQTDLFARNARTLGLDLRAVDLAVLSHGHYDHGGGLQAFLSINQTAPVYLHRLAFEPHYNGERYNGLDPALLQSDRLIFTEGVTEIAPGLTLDDCNRREKICDFGSFGLDKLVNGRRLPDDFLHEQYLLIEEQGKRVLISGCSHKGIVNIAHWFRPDVLVGGFHFFKLPADDTLRGYAKQLAAMDIRYETCHCTGVEQFAFMKRFMPELHYLSAGDSVTI